MELIHGGDRFGYMQRHRGKQPLDFSVNINPLGLPEPVKQVLQNAQALSGIYPDPLCRALRAAIAEKEGISSDFIHCGNGAADILYLLARVLAPKYALIPAPAFSEYERSLAGSRIVYFPLKQQNEFCLTADIIEKITPQTDVLYLCQPNNPTGKLTEPELLERIMHRCGETGTYLIVDECFIDFTGLANRYSAKAYLQEYPRLIILKAFTKFYAMPGIRLGYCMCSDLALMQKLREAGQPWNVSSIAQACGAAALEDKAYEARTLEEIAAEREFLENGLAALGLRVFSSRANFILFYAQDDMLHEKLEKRGIMIRNCRNFEGLTAGYYRAAVRTHEENKMLLGCMKKCL